MEAPFLPLVSEGLFWCLDFDAVLVFAQAPISTSPDTPLPPQPASQSLTHTESGRARNAAIEVGHTGISRMQSLRFRTYLGCLVAAAQFGVATGTVQRLAAGAEAKSILRTPLFAVGRSAICLRPRRAGTDGLGAKPCSPSSFTPLRRACARRRSGHVDWPFARATFGPQAAQASPRSNRNRGGVVVVQPVHPLPQADLLTC
jgi:hypothetical protein